jgi:Zn-dependent peptidase ImmA (M78 family)
MTPSKIGGNVVQLEMLQKTARNLLRPQLMHGPPFDPYSVAAEMDVTVTETDTAGALGYVQRTEDRFQVFLSSGLTAERKRFTLGHELGHVVLMRAASDGLPVNLVRYRKTGCPPGIEEDPAEEALCNSFAAELLMPTWHVSELLREHGDNPGVLFDIKRLFRVSLHAAATRLMTLRGARRTSSISLWDCSTPWPTTQWWVGRRPENSERDAIESLVRAVNVDRGCVEINDRAPKGGKRTSAARFSRRNAKIRMDVRLLRDGRWMLVSMREASSATDSRDHRLSPSAGTTSPPGPVSPESRPAKPHKQLAMSFAD